MRETIILKVCAWSGTAGVLIILFSFWVAGFTPIPSPVISADAIKALIIDNRSAIKFGMIGSMMGAGLLVGYAASLCLHMKRIEGQFSPLSYIQLGAGSLLALEFIYLAFFWQTATFRVDRSPELIELLNDMAWIPFVGLSSTLILQALVFGLAILTDRHAVTIFPRWLGFFSLFASFMFLPGTFNVFFMTGPLAWNGILAIYIPVIVFLIWTISNCYFMSRAVDSIEFDSPDIPVQK